MSRLAISFALNLALVTLALGASTGEKIDISPAVAVDDISRVTIQLDAGGHNLVRPAGEDKAPAAGSQSATADERLPVSVAAKFTYEERRLTSDFACAAGTPLAIRYYETADATIKVDNTGRTPTLPDERRTIVLEQAATRPLVYCPAGALTREQLDLVNIIGDSVVIDRLLPNKPVGEGDTWNNDGSVMGALLTLDSVAVCESQCILEGFNADFAKVRLAGVVHGTEDGAATQQEVRAVFLVDRHQRRVTKLNLAVRDKRTIGGATPGLDAVAKMQISVEPLKAPIHLNQAAVSAATKPATTTAHELTFEAPRLGFRVNHDRQWFVTAEQREAVTLKRVDQGDLIAQTTLTVLPSKGAGRQTSLEQFQKDITFTLGKSFGELVSSRQWQNAAGHYCYEVVVRGMVEELPVEWHYYLVAPESGPRVSVTVTIEKPMVDRVAGADRALVETLQLFPAMPEAKTAVAPVESSAR